MYWPAVNKSLRCQKREDPPDTSEEVLTSLIQMVQVITSHSEWTAIWTFQTRTESQRSVGLEWRVVSDEYIIRVVIMITRLSTHQPPICRHTDLLSVGTPTTYLSTPTYYLSTPTLSWVIIAYDSYTMLTVIELVDITFNLWWHLDWTCRYNLQLMMTSRLANKCKAVTCPDVCDVIK